MYHILSLIPYSKSSKGKVSPWYLVILNKWVNTHRFFKPFLETSLTYDRKKGIFCFMAYWMHSNNASDEFFFKKWKAPWGLSLYKKEILKNNTDTCDTFKTSFYVYKKGKKIPIKVIMNAYKLTYSFRILPNFLKDKFNKVKEISKITLKGFKHSCVYFPFKKDLPTSWLNFEYYELPKYLKSLYKDTESMI